MNINGIRNDSGSAVSALLALNGNQANSSSEASAASGSTPATASSVSKPGELMAKLSQLLEQSPDKFKQVTQQIADDLKTQASAASGPQAQFLSKLSDQFAQASSSGSLASLAPPSAGEREQHAGAAHHPHGGHHGGGGGGAGGIESVLSKALDEVNQALSANPSASA